MNLTVEQARDKEVYEKLAVLAEGRIKPGEEKIWEVLPFDPESPYHAVSNSFIEPSLDIDPAGVTNLASFAVADYKKDRQDDAREVVETTIANFREQIGEPVREIVDAGEHLAVNVDHQSRFSPLLVSAFIQLAVGRSVEEQLELRKISETLVTRYLGCYGIKLGETLGDPDFPTINALRAGSNLSGIIPIFPSTEIRDVAGIDSALQKDANAKAVFRSRPRKSVPKIRTFCASAASDELLDDGGYKMRTIDHDVKRLFKIGKWHVISVATNIDEGNTGNSFFVPSEITHYSDYDMSTLDEHNLWIAQTRSDLTGQPVNYEPSKA